MKPWNKRPREIRNLFNPVFCSLVIVRGIQGFSTQKKEPIPFSLALLILPICLHKQTRELFKKSSRTYFTKIVQNHPEIKIDFAKRAEQLLPYTMEAFAYLSAFDYIDVNEAGAIQLTHRKIRKSIVGSNDSKDCQKVALSIGKKMAAIDDRVTIYTTLGIRP